MFLDGSRFFCGVAGGHRPARSKVPIGMALAFGKAISEHQRYTSPSRIDKALPCRSFHGAATSVS
jgi:hypothetical protein